MGLLPPKRKPETHLFMWTTDGLQRPPYLRWAWHPVSGDLVAGTVHHHYQQIPRDPERPFESWLRGFVFPKERIVPIRTYWWPLTPYDEFDEQDAQQHRLVASTFITLVRPSLPRLRFVSGINNEWLRSNCGKYGDRW
jgi:hypothetical protein